MESGKVIEAGSAFATTAVGKALDQKSSKWEAIKSLILLARKNSKALVQLAEIANGELEQPLDAETASALAEFLDLRGNVRETISDVICEVGFPFEVEAYALAKIPGSDEKSRSERSVLARGIMDTDPIYREVLLTYGFNAAGVNPDKMRASMFERKLKAAARLILASEAQQTPDAERSVAETREARIA